MNAIRMSAHGGPEVMVWTPVPRPEPAAGEALVRVEAAGVNFIDTYQRAGHYAIALPATPGSEGAGTVVAVGEGVTEVRAGDRVAYQGVLGAYAEFAAVPAARLVLLPDSITARQAAAVMLQGMTAHYLTASTFPLGPAHTCLVHAAAGGVGLLLCQIARRRGARVIGTVSTREKAALAREAGADHVILYTERDFEAETREVTNGAGVDVVYDSVGMTTFDRSLACLKARGTMVLFGQASGPVPPLDPQVLNRRGSLYLTRPSLAHYVATRNELLWRAGEILGWIAEDALQVRVGLELPLSQAAEAHRLLEGRATTGKVLLITAA